MKELNELKKWVSSIKWRYAYTMKWCPHWYIVRNTAINTQYTALFNAIERYGEVDYFYQTPRKYLYLGDGYRYWHCQRFDEFGIVEINDDSKIINRGKATDKGKYSTKTKTSR